MCGKAKRKFTASQSVWWGFIVRKFTYKTECYVEPNVTLSCEAPRRGAPDCEQASNRGLWRSHNLGTVTKYVILTMTRYFEPVIKNS